MNSSPGATDAETDAAIFRYRFFDAYGAGNGDDTRCWKYNGVCVGGYDAHGSFGLGTNAFNDNFIDDTPVYAYKNFVVDGAGNPGTNREQPLLVASAIGLFVTNHTHASVVQASGTSFSTPAISGLAGLAMAVFPNLRTEPTILRAALLASAKHNISDTPVPIFGDAIDDRDGAGAPRGDRLMQLLFAWAFGGPQLRGGVLDRDTDFNSAGEVVIPIHMEFGQRIRVALTWDVCPYAAQTGVYDHLTIDLDLVVEGPPGSDGKPLFYKTNPSMVDNYELLEFSATATGDGRIRIQAPRWNGCSDLAQPVIGIKAIFPSTPRRTYYGLAYDITAPLQ